MLSKSISSSSFGALDPVISEAVDEAAHNLQEALPLAEERARAVLIRASSELERRVLDLVGTLSTYEWIWLLRRLPLETIPHRIDSTPPYVVRVAQTLASRSRMLCVGTNRKNGSIYFTVDKGKISRLRQLVAAAICIQRVHAMVRLVGKGAQLTQSSGSVNCIFADPSIQPAIDLFDRRARLGDHFLSAVGIIDSEQKMRTEPRSANADPLSSTIWLPTNTNLLRSDEPRFIPQIINIDLLMRLTDLTDTRYEDIIDLLVILDSILSAASRDLPSLVNLYRVGYAVVSRRDLKRFVGRSISRLRKAGIMEAHGEFDVGHFTALKVIERLRKSEAELLPLSSSQALIDIGQNAMLDGYSATARLKTILEVGNHGGEPSNIRAAIFEQLIQQTIDQSPCRPRGYLRNLIGRTVSDELGHITDIDCIAETSEFVLMIDCKSKVRSRAFECGEYLSVRNIRTALEKAADDWTSKVTRIAKTDVMSKEARTILGIVCTPFIPFVISEGSRTIVLPGLRHVSSASELDEWLAAQHASA